MVDYYAEFNIDSSLGVDEINKELSRLENIWKRRELNNPEKATKMLALIIDTREVFQSTATKSRYDRELAESRQTARPATPDQQRKDDFQKWRADAKMYYNRGEFDLAKIAVDRALSLVTDSLDDDIYSIAAVIYMENGENSAALSFINNAIVTNPQNGLYYLLKADIYGYSASAIELNDCYQASQYYNEGRRTLETGLNVANSTGDTYAKGRLLGALAFSLYFNPNHDKVRAEEMAREALALDENLGSAQMVINAANEQHRIEREREEQAAREQRQREEAPENARKERIYKEAKGMAELDDIPKLKWAISKFESIQGYKDSVSQIENIVTKIQRLEKEKQRKKKERKSEYKTIGMAMFAIVLSIMVLLFIFIIIYLVII